MQWYLILIKARMFLHYPLRRNFLILIFAILCILYLVFTVLIGGYFTSESIACYRIKSDSLPDISDTEPVKGKSIFFHETSCNSHIHNKIVISSREACAVESAARMNPNYDIYLLYTSPGVIKYEGTASDRFLKALLTYKNLKIYHLDYERYTKDTPLEDLYKSGKIESSSYALSHASDVLRYLTLLKYGGTYLDLDLIVIKSLEDLPPNYAGSESERNVAAGVLNFAPTGNGRYFGQLCVEDLKRNFNGKDWGNNGPGVITRLLKKICDAEKAKDMLNKDCQGFNVYPPEAFYFIPWWDWAMFFDPIYNDKLLNMSKDSYVVHVWNKYSVNTKIDVKSDVPYSIFAKTYCPKVFSECDEYF